MDAEVLVGGRKAKRAALAAGTLDITVLMGGPSSEREVSLVSGRAVADALKRRGHKVTMSDIGPRDLSALERKGAELAFIALHGAFGEDGAVQSLCRQRGLPYVGSGPRASALAMDKAASKEVFLFSGLDTPDWAVIDSAMAPARRAELLAGMGLPCVLKPIDGGSSVGVSIVREAAAARKALDELLASHGRALAEKFIAGREMTVGILGERALPVIEIRSAREFYDYYAKYQDDKTQYVLDTQLPQQAIRRLQAAGLAAHLALGCRDFSRVDFILAEDGTPYVLEVNTIPGFTSHSLLPKAAAAAGIGFDELCDRIARMAMRRPRR